MLTDVVGRTAAVTDLRALLNERRLVTLTGPGGVGKTRLALETATQAADAFPDGVWLVELAGPALAGARTPADAVMAVLGIRDDSSMDPSDLLADALRTSRMLLILDNCEHLVDQAAKLTAQLLQAAPGLRILVTSREPLMLAGEVVWAVPPLTQSSAVQLFVVRAGASAPGFRLDEDNAQAVAGLCRRLDGIPLALELAATRVRTLGVHELLARLDDRFRLLVTGHRDAPPRQQTLWAVIDWSWELLTEPERLVLRRLAVAADGCGLHAAEAICAEDDLDVLGLLARLVDRSLVVVADGPDGPRYRLLESVAAYGLQRLGDAGESGELGCGTAVTTPISPNGRHLAFAATTSGPGSGAWTPRPPTCAPPWTPRSATTTTTLSGWSTPWPGTGSCAAGSPKHGARWRRPWPSAADPLPAGPRPRPG